MAKKILMHLWYEILDLGQFLANPNRRKYGTRRDSWLSVRFITLLVIMFVLVVTISLPIDQTLQNLADISNKKQTVDYPFIADLFIFAPVLEEIIFRAGLRSATYTLLLGPLAVTVIFAGKVFALAAAVFSLAVAGYVLVGRYNERHGVSGQRFVRARIFIHWYPVIFWTYAGSFALTHVVNHTFSGRLGMLVVFSVTPQLFLAAAAGYLRIRNGLKSAIGFHIAYNLGAVLLYML